ncbi:MAG: hypothetical protein KDB53_12995, partial [Planctomycetes bacterium]|nr:hypothetical protein [Planctomycetota bacterium]
TSELQAPSSAPRARGGRGGGRGNATARRTSPRVRADGHFAAGGLLAGIYTLEIRVGDILVETVTGLEVPVGEVAKPDRLANLVVGQGIDLGVVHVTDMQGRPVSGARVRFVDLADETSRMFGGTERTNDEGDAKRVIQVGRAMRLEVSHADYADLRSDVTGFPARLQLSQGGQLAVQFSAALPTVEGVRGYRLVATPVGDAGAGNGFGRGGRPGRRTQDLAAGVAGAELDRLSGDYTLSLEIRPDPALFMGAGGRRGGGGRQGRPDGQRRVNFDFRTGLSLPLGTVQVNGEGRRSQTVQIDDAALNAIMEQLQASLPAER